MVQTSTDGATNRNYRTRHLPEIGRKTRNSNNGDVLRQIAGQELEHASFWETKTGIVLKPKVWKVRRTVFLAQLLGLTFVLKQMEKREGTGSRLY